MNAFPTIVLPKLLDIPDWRNSVDQNQRIARKPRKTDWQHLRELKISVVADSVTFDDLSSYKFQATMLTPSGLFTSLRSDPDTFYHAYAVGQKMEEIYTVADISELVILALDRILVELAVAFFDRVPGPHFTFIDPRYRKGSNEIIARVRSLVEQFEDKGIDRNRIVVNIPSTEDGVCATNVLCRDRINVNLTFIGDASHAIICALAGAAYVTFDFSALSTAYAIRGRVNRALETIKHAILYFSLHNIQTKILVCDLSDTVGLSGLHYICLNSYQTLKAQRPVQPTVKPGHLSSPPNIPVLQAPVEYTKRLFKSDNEGGFDGKFLQYVSSDVHDIIVSTHSSALIGIEETMNKLYNLIKENVVEYRILCSRLASPENGMKTLESLALRSLINTIEKQNHVDKGYRLWADTLSGVVVLSSIRFVFVYEEKNEDGRELEQIELSDDYFMKDGFRVFTIRIPSHFGNQ